MLSVMHYYHICSQLALKKSVEIVYVVILLYAVWTFTNLQAAAFVTCVLQPHEGMDQAAHTSLITQVRECLLTVIPNYYYTGMVQ